MSIAVMSHLRLVGLRRDQNKIIDKLVEHGLFEVRTVDSVPNDASSENSDLYKSLKLKQSRVTFALEFLKARHLAMSRTLNRNKKEVRRGKADIIDYSLSSANYSDGRILITKADFSDARANEFELLGVCDALQQISFDITDAQARISTLKSATSAYRPYTVVPVKLSELKRDGDVLLSAYYCESGGDPYEMLKDLPCAYDVRRNGGTVVITVCRKANNETVKKALGAAGYTECPFSDDCTATQKTESFAAEIKDLERRTLELTESALGYEKYLNELRILYDVIGLEIERAEAEQKFLKTDSTFVLEGWMPEGDAQKTVDELKKECSDVFVQLLAAEEKDAPPTLVKSNAVVKPYEQITDMYSSPRYGEIDPNPIMAVFYFLFFGIMIGDAAYGLILAVAGFFIGRSKKFDTGIKKLALLVGMGGISAILWGVLFGGYFSIDFGKNVAILLNPIEQPLLLLALSIVLGVVQITVGYIIKFVALCREGKPFSAVFDCGSMILLFMALGFLVAGMLPSLAPMLGIEVSFAPPPWLSVVAAVLALTGVAIILIFGGRNSKNVFGKVVGGFKGLYGLINVVSDILSYCRLFGLCLASCAIGLAFNELGNILFGIPGVGYVIGVLVLIPLHMFNLALGVLSAYVHDARLQFLEFYSKFYDGGGRLFSPLGVRTKYVRFA